MKAWKQKQQDYTQHERILLEECLRFAVEFLDGKHVPKKQTNRDARKRWIPSRDQRGLRTQ